MVPQNVMRNAQRQTNWYNLWLCYAISLSLIGFGYPSAIIGTTLGEPSFLVYMGLLDLTTGTLTKNANGLIGAMSGIFQAGAIIGLFLICVVMDRWGRKPGVLCACAFSIFGGVLLTASQNVAMFIVARFFAGAGSWGYLAVASVYATELAPPALRGFFVGLIGVNAALGYALASYMGLAFFYTNNAEAQWRAPLGLALIWPLMIMVLMIFVPESPRWLLLNNKVDKAREIVMKIHSSKSDPDHQYAQEELYQMQKQIELDRTLPSSWWDLFNVPNMRKRTLLGILFAFTGQSTGVLVFNNYGPTIYASLGYGTRDQLALQCGWITVNVVGALAGAAIMDRLGRRMLVFPGLIICIVFLCIEAAVVASFAESGTNKAGLRVGVAAAYVFLAGYSLFDVTGFVFYAELFPNHLRSKGMTICITTTAVVDLIYLQVSATAFANIGWKFYLVFLVLTTVSTAALFFTLPETGSLPLEEIATVFGNKDQVVVYLEDIRMDQNTHELIVEEHEGRGIARITTSLDLPGSKLGRSEKATDTRSENIST